MAGSSPAPAGSPHHIRLTLAPPPGFNFWRTAFSHGWCALPPFIHDPVTETLERTLELPDGMLVHTELRAAPKGISVSARSSTPFTASARRAILGQIRTCLRLDENLEGFYCEADRHPRYRWIRKAGAGRMLRAPTAFEDAVKIICTTNCTWALTTIMVTNLVRAAGRTTDGVRYAFPAPEALASLSERDLRLRCTTGYRAPYIRELARRVASGELTIEGWRSSPLTTEELDREMRNVKGMGPYAVGNMLRLVGRCDSLALDTWVRGQFFRLHKKGRRVSDAVIQRHYAPYGSWRGLFFWLEMTRAWHDGKFKL